MTRAALLAISFAVAAASCYEPVTRSCVVRCDEGCAMGLVCDYGLCRDPRVPEPATCDPCAIVDEDFRTDIFVDASSTFGDRGVGTTVCPYATITAGLVAAVRTQADAVVVHVAEGIYGAATEVFPLVVRGNTSLRGAGADRTIIAGERQFLHARQGGLLEDGYHATILLGDETGTPSIADLTVRRESTTPIVEVFGIVCDRGRVTPGQDPGPPSATVERVVVGPGYATGIVVSNTKTSACNLSVTGSTFTGSANGIWLAGCGLGQGVLPVAADIGDGTTAGANRFELLRTAAGFGDTSGISLWDCATRVRIRGSFFTSSAIGVDATSYLTSDGLEIDGNTFADLPLFGVKLDNRQRLRSLRDNTFRNISSPNLVQTARAVIVKGSSSIVAARGNTFFGNDEAVHVFNDPLSADRVLDFGRPDDFGRNVFRCNSHWSPTSPGYDVSIDVLGTSTAPALFDGNAWDHVPPTTAAGPGAPNGTDVVDAQRGGGMTTISAGSPSQATGDCPDIRQP